MPSHGSYASALQTYNTSIDDVAARVQQDRTLHMHDLTTTYMHAISSGMPDQYLNMLERTIGERKIYNDRKMVFDAADLTLQNSKLTRALGANKGTLSGGGVHDTSRAALKGMHYSVQRANALYANFNQKLSHDRTVHANELSGILRTTPKATQTASVLKSLINMRETNNANRTLHDARMWADVDSRVGAIMGGGHNATDVINYGVSNTLTGGGNNTILKPGSSFHFGSADASKLWQHIMA